MALDLGYGIYVCLGVYLVFIIAIAAYGRISSKQQSISDYYLAGQNLGNIVLTFTLLAFLTSGYNYVGIPGDAFRNGFVALRWSQVDLGIFLIGALWAPQLFRLIRTKGFVAPYQLLMYLYDSKALALLYSFTWIAYGSVQVLAQCKAMGDFVEGLVGIPAVYGASFLVVVVLVYESVGGFKSVVFTDVLQGVMLIIGGTFLYFVVGSTFGGIGRAVETLNASDDEYTAVPTQRQLVSWASFIIITSLAGFNAPAIQRIISAKDEQIVKNVYIIGLWTTYFRHLPAILLGVQAIARFPDLRAENSDQLISLVFRDLLDLGNCYYWVVSIFISVLIAAVMSSLDSALMSVGYIFVGDVLKGLLWPDMSDKKALILGRIFNALLLFGCLAISLFWKIDLTSLFVMQSGITAQLFVGLFVPLVAPDYKLKALEVLSGAICGICLLVILAAIGYTQILGVDVGLWAFLVNSSVLGAVHVSRRIASHVVKRNKKSNYAELQDTQLMEDLVSSIDTMAPISLPAYMRINAGAIPWYLGALLGIFIAACLPVFSKPGSRQFVVLGLPTWTLISVVNGGICILVATITIAAYWRPLKRLQAVGLDYLTTEEGVGSQLVTVTRDSDASAN